LYFKLFFVHLALPEIQYTSIVICYLLRGSVGLMYALHGRYCSPTGRSKLAHHAVCTVRPVIMVHVRCLMIYDDLLLSCYSCNQFTSLSFLLYEIQRGPYRLLHTPNKNKHKFASVTDR